MNVLFVCFTVFLLILGAAQLWELLVLLLYRPKTGFLRFEIVPLEGSVDNLELLLQYVELTSSAAEVLLLDRGLGEEERKLCARFCDKHCGFCLVTEEDVKTMIFPQKELECGENP